MEIKYCRRRAGSTAYVGVGNVISDEKISHVLRHTAGCRSQDAKLSGSFRLPSSFHESSDHVRQTVERNTLLSQPAELMETPNWIKLFFLHEIN